MLPKKNVEIIAVECAFVFDHPNHAIVGSKADFERAGEYGSAYSKRLDAMMAAHPDYPLEVSGKPTKNHAKNTYAGLTMPLMEKYLDIYDGELAEEMRTQFAALKAKQKAKEISYAVVKSWFIDLFPNFNVNKAKREIDAANLEKTKAPHKVIRVSVATAVHTKQ